MKKVLSVLLTLMLVATTFPMSIVFADEIVASESLTQQDGVYLINNAADLKKAAEMVNDGSSATASFKLMADIDYLNNEWTPMGISGFNGKFDGNGHVIKNVKMTKNNNVNGFFGDIWETGEVSNLGLENLTMNISGGYWAGAFASRCYGKFTNCYVANSSLTNNGWALGGFVGAPANAGRFTNCYVYNVALNGFAAPAGFAGKLEGYCYFNNCYTADVTTTASEFYNFIYNTNGKSVTKSYCYSNMNSVNPTGSQTDATVGTKEEIKNALVAFDASYAFKVNSKINNGYPALSYQKAAAYDNEYEVTMLSTADGIKARIETNEAVDGATVYVATYDNDGRLIAAEALDADTIVTSTLSTDGADTIKVFVWDANINPLAEAFVK